MSLLQRRVFLGQSTRGLGALALASLMNPKSSAAESAKGAITLHHAPKIKRVIWLVMAGGPSHLETFDYRPKLAAMDGKPMPESFTKGQPIAQLQGQQLKCLAPQHKFKKFGKSGQEMCELFPHLGEVADDICIVRSLHTEAINHDPAHTFINTGTTISGRPSMGSWITYGLGSETKDLPGFVVLTSQGRGGQNQPISSRQWHSGFLPSQFQGVHLRGQGDPVLYLTSPAGVSREQQRDTVSAIQNLNNLHNGTVDDPEIATRIKQYEMAFAMQASVPGLMELKQEDKKTLDLYGTKGADGTFAANCLLARRLAERGVRFIQLYHRDWDHHGGIRNDIKLKIEEVDRPLMALIRDLKQKGLFDDTLIVWGGEFGRTPMSQGGSGRDHHMKGFSMWLAGGGIKGGLTHGSTDDFGYNAVENVVSVHDLHATVLHLLGINHERFSVKFQGLDAKLSGVEPCRVVKEILA